MNHKSGYIKVQGGKIWYSVFNPHGKGLPLFLLHGGPGASSRAFLPLQKALSKNRPVVVYDQLGCGKSDKPKNKKLWRKERFVTELETLRAHLMYERVILLGHSWGAMLAVLYTLQFSRRVASLILSGPYLSTPRWIRDTSALQKSLPRDVQTTIKLHESRGTTSSKEYGEATLAFYKKFYCRTYPYPKAIREGHKQMGLDVYNTMWGPTEFHCTGNLKKVDLTNKLKEIAIPILFMCGKYDMATPHTTKFYSGKCRNARAVIFTRSAHCLFAEEQSKYVKTVADFLRDLS